MARGAPSLAAAVPLSCPIGPFRQILYRPKLVLKLSICLCQRLVSFRMVLIDFGQGWTSFSLEGCTCRHLSRLCGGVRCRRTKGVSNPAFACPRCSTLAAKAPAAAARSVHCAPSDQSAIGDQITGVEDDNVMGLEPTVNLREFVIAFTQLKGPQPGPTVLHHKRRPV
jgi:hypothetical protein